MHEETLPTEKKESNSIQYLQPKGPNYQQNAEDSQKKLTDPPFENVPTKDKE